MESPTLPIKHHTQWAHYYYVQYFLENAFCLLISRYVVSIFLSYTSTSGLNSLTGDVGGILRSNGPIILYVICVQTGYPFSESRIHP